MGTATGMGGRRDGEGALRGGLYAALTHLVGSIGGGLYAALSHVGGSIGWAGWRGVLYAALSHLVGIVRWPLHDVLRRD
jgi:hypothetical protein